MKDALGRVIKEGDTLFYGTTGRYPEFMQCKVLRMTSRSLMCKKTVPGRPDAKEGDVVRIRDTSHCVVITQLLFRADLVDETDE